MSNTALSPQELAQRAFVSPHLVTHGELLACLERVTQENAELAADLESEKKDTSRQVELAEEQIYFARELVENLQEVVKTLPPKHQKALLAALDDASFEA